MWLPPHLAPSEVVFLTGAGISADAPTNGPIGNELTARALSHAFLPGTLEEVRLGYATLGFDKWRVPRLEAVLEIASQVHGPQVLDDLLEDLTSARPNELHRFFAEHVLAGGGHLTANFDIAIERARPGVDVLHFHGSLAAGTAGLGATLSRIERGFTDDVEAQVRNVLQGRRRTLVVAGYSGLDFFDMDQFIAKHADALRNSIRHTIWISHDHTAAFGEMTAVASTGPPMFTTLAEAGVDCTTVRAQTVSVLDALARRWGLSPLGTPCRDDVDWTPRAALAETDCAEATRRLYLHMGMYGSHSRLLARNPELGARVSHHDLAEIAWQEGRLSDAKKHWSDVFAGSTDERVARRLERVAACAWDAGAYLRAYATVLVAIRSARRSGDAEALALTLELQARILVHMSRLPDLRWLVTERHKQAVASRLRAVVDTNTFGSGIKPRFLDAAELLVSDPERRHDTKTKSASVRAGTSTWSDTFVQYESMSGTLDYRRGEMRRAVASGKNQMTSEWLDRYRQSAEFLGKRAAFSTTPLLPGAAAIFPWSDGVRLLLRRSKATPWHRLRMSAIFTARHLRERSGHMAHD